MNTTPSPPTRLPQKLLLSLGKAGINIFLVILTVTVWQSGSRLVNEVGKFLSFQKTEPEIDISNILIEKLRNASELTTAVYAMETVVPAQQSRQILGVTLGTTRLLYVAYGEVKAGVDLSQLTAEDIRVENDRVIVTLPAPVILDSKIDVNRSRVYDYSRGFLSLGPDVGPQLQSQAAQETLHHMIASACQEGVLVQAGDRAELAVKELLTLSGHEQVEIEAAPPNLTACPILPKIY
ncbi:DUF4230 domain-containing protein [Spirulina subsalsa FACHB-351]|uniref:DUF4230 domain-containing protein n=1 Tax=Spirulina subsalsa FACHB-351 TaxID=234711 RepID=A0ABT3L0Y3_9CYAN|nr:DUF4230 domain-containing protein [Spirulina subsalsa]MCW6035163.1 DUF4230 domain-containing protein [Spirulina subsalsa FACHB-351]